MVMQKRYIFNCFYHWHSAFIQLFIKQIMQASTLRIATLLLLLLLAPSTTARAFMKVGETSNAETTYRQMVYEQSTARINLYNQKFSEHYVSAHNEFSDLTPKEFAAMYLGGRMSEPGSPERMFVQGPSYEQKSNLKSEEKNKAGLSDISARPGILNDVNPTSFTIDYSLPATLLITNVKNQGGCGSCWAFAGIGEIQSFFLKNHNLYLDLSEQQMVDCLPAVQSGNAGCGGGQLDSVGYYAAQFPIAQEKYYPYTAVQGTCNNDRINEGKTFNINSYVYISDCITLTNVLLNLKPIGVCGYIDGQWQSYSSGVVTNCNTNLANGGGHCVLLVGATSDGTTTYSVNYWKIRNSWGTGWGEGGFMRLWRDPADTTTGPCGFCGSAIYSV